MTDTRVSNIVRFSLFQADLRTGELCKAGLRVRIQEQPFKILAALLEKPNEVVTREELRQRIWPRESFGDFDHAIDLAVGKLRTALGDSAGTPRFVETLPRRGYRFIAPVSAVAFPEIGRTDSAPSSSISGSELVPPRSGTARSWKLWSSLAVILLSLAGVAAFRFHHSASAPRPGSVLVAHFENRTGEPAFDGTLEYAMQRELSNSGFLQVVPSERVDDVLRLMKKPVNTPLDLAMAKEVCLRDGTIQGLVTGQVQKLGSVYLLSATIVDPMTGAILQSVSEEADSATAISAAVRRLSNQVRTVAGESLTQIKESNAMLEQATTPSLRALQLYSRGMMFVNEERWGPARELLEQAVQADPDFASAHVYLAYCYSNVGKGRKADEHFKRAFALADTATDRERYFILGSYYDSVGQAEKSIESYEVLVRLFPDHYWGENNLQIAYEAAGRYGEAVSERTKQAQLHPNDYLANLRAWWAVQNWSKNPGTALPYYDAALRLSTPELQEGHPLSVNLAFFKAYQFLRQGNPAQALAEADRLSAQTANLQSSDYRQSWLESLGDLYLTCGKIKLAERWYRQLSDEGEKQAYLTGIAEARGDRDELRGQLRRQFARGAEMGPGTVARLAQAGMLSMAREVVSKLEKQGSPEKWLAHAHGELDLAGGRTEQGIRELRNAVRLYQLANDPHRYMAGIALARALDRRGDTSAAIEVLQPMIEPSSGEPDELKLDVQLARLYRKVGRAEEAERLEARVDNQLAYADSDSELLTELRYHSNTP